MKLKPDGGGTLYVEGREMLRNLSRNMAQDLWWLREGCLWFFFPLLLFFYVMSEFILLPATLGGLIHLFIRGSQPWPIWLYIFAMLPPILFYLIHILLPPTEQEEQKYGRITFPREERRRPVRYLPFFWRAFCPSCGKRVKVIMITYHYSFVCSCGFKWHEWYDWGLA